MDLIKEIQKLRRKIQITGDEIDCVDCGKSIITSSCDCEGYNEGIDDVVKLIIKLLG